MHWNDLVNPMKVHFPIFWFPVAIPLFVNALGALVFDLGQLGTTLPGIDASAVGGGIAVVILRIINLSFVSTDVWALTTVISYIVRSRLDPSHTVAFMFGAVIALFWHLLTYLMIALSLARGWSLWLDVTLLLKTPLQLLGAHMLRQGWLLAQNSQETQQPGP